MRRKGISLISAAIFLALIIVATIIVYNAGMPIIRNMQAAATIDNMKDFFTQLDEVVQTVASEGKGSKRTVYMDINYGKLIVNDTKNSIEWVYETEADVISPRTAQDFGNIRVGSNLETTAYEGTYQEIDALVMENQHLMVYARKIGSQSSHDSYNTSEILLGIYHKHLNQWLNNTGFIYLTLDNNITSMTGTGYTALDKTGYNLPYATVTSFLDSDYGVAYYITMTLESDADFLQIGAHL